MGLSSTCWLGNQDVAGHRRAIEGPQPLDGSNGAKRQESTRSPTGDEPCGQQVDPRQVYEALAAVLKTAWRELSGV